MEQARSVDNYGLFCSEIRLHNGRRVSLARRGVLWQYSRVNYRGPNDVPESIPASLARSEAQIAVGQTVPLEPVLDRLRSSIARMQADADENLKPPSPKA